MLKQLVAKFLEWLDDLEDKRRMDSMVRYWRQSGAIDPYADAEEERALRLKLEEFRTFASDEYLRDPSQTRDQIKQKWLDRVVKPMASVPQAREAAKCLKVAITAMGEEMFVGAAARARKIEIELAMKTASEQVDQLKTDMRHRALKK